METFLDKILIQKKAEVAQLRPRAGSLKPRSSEKRSFTALLDKSPRLAIIAEVKKASPSKGLICKDFDPVKIATRYETGGASAISVLTDEKFFMGHTEYLIHIREAVALPVLRKDFIIDPLQVQETASINADAMLLIAEALDAVQLSDLYQTARELDLEVLIELHSIRELDKVMRLDPPIVGINNRDLATFSTNLATTIDIIRHIPKNVIVVAESGIKTGTDAEMLCNAGVRALLVGESLTKAEKVEELLAELIL